MPLRRQYCLGMKKIKLAYFGSPDFAADFLEKILLDKSLPVEIKLVVTQPDQPVGRKQILTPTPVKKVAEKFKRSEDIISPKAGFGIELTNIDLSIVYAFGEVISKEILDLPKYGFWNIHPSLLPKYRGPSPIAAPLINGDEKTGITIIKMDEEIDHGPIVAQQSLTIKKTDKRPDLEKKLTNLAYGMFKKILAGEPTKFFATWDTPAEGVGRIPTGDKKFRNEPFIAQNHKQSTYTKKLTKQDGFIEFENLKLRIENSPEKLYNLFRGLYPWPGIWTIIKSIQPTRLDEIKRLKITDLELVNGKLIIKKVQLEGKKEVDFETFNKAYKIF